MKHARDLWASCPWDCPHAFGAAGLANLSPALICATCRKRSCPVCGEYWKLTTFRRFGFYIFTHDGELFTATVSDFDWPAIRKDMARRAKKLNTPLRYVATRCKEGDELVIIASVPILADAGRPVEPAAALAILEKAIDDIFWGRRPFSSCRAWGPLETEREAERVPGGCTLPAFVKTVKAWGADVSEKQQQRRVVKPNRSGMLADDTGKNLDAMAQSHFWREAETRDYAGEDAARQVHEQLTQERKQRRPAAPPCQSCSPADRKTEIAPDGRQRQVCGKCGTLYGYLR